MNGGPVEFIIAILLTASTVPAIAKSEAEYAKEWANEHDGEIEVRLPDNTRCDVVTATHAVEVDFAAKWEESIGQALFYALQTNKRAGIVLIIQRAEERRNLVRLNSVILAYKLPIDVWTVGRGAPAESFSGSAK